MIDLKDVQFDVVRKPLFTEDGLAANKDAIVRKDTGAMLGVVGKTYPLMEHKTALGSVTEAVKTLGDGFELKKLCVTGNGAKMFAHLEGKREYDISSGVRKVGDLIRPVLILINSINGSTKLGFKIGAMRLVCLNGMTSAITMANISVRHTSGVNFDEVLSRGAEALQTFEHRSIPKWQHMMVTPVNREFAIKQLSDKRLGIPDAVNKRVIELHREESTETLWDLYNQYTHFLTHEYRGNEERRQFISGAVERVLGGL